MLLIHSYHVSNAGHLPAGSCAATTGLSRQHGHDACTAAPQARRMKCNTPPATCTSNQELCSLIVSQKGLRCPTASCVPACAWNGASAIAAAGARGRQAHSRPLRPRRRTCMKHALARGTAGGRQAHSSRPACIVHRCAPACSGLLTAVLCPCSPEAQRQMLTIRLLRRTIL